MMAVKFGRLTEPLEVVRIGSGATLAKFLNLRGLEYGPSIRVNGDEVDLETVLHEGDIITDIDSVSGGR